MGVYLAVTGLANGQGGVQARLALDQVRIPAGGLVRGSLILNNPTATPRVLLRGCVVDGRFGVGLRPADGGYFQGVMFAHVGCRPRPLIVARTGVTVYRFTIRASYGACIQSAGNQEPTGSTPAFLGISNGRRNTAPALSPGKYLAVFFPDGRWLGPAVRPARVAVTAAVISRASATGRRETAAARLSRA